MKEKGKNTKLSPIIFFLSEKKSRLLWINHPFLYDSVFLFSGMLKFCEKNGYTPLDLSVSFLRRGHANLLCIVPILTDDPFGSQLYYCFADIYTANLNLSNSLWVWELDNYFPSGLFPKKEILRMIKKIEEKKMDKFW